MFLSFKKIFFHHIVTIWYDVWPTDTDNLCRVSFFAYRWSSDQGAFWLTTPYSWFACYDEKNSIWNTTVKKKVHLKWWTRRQKLRRDRTTAGSRKKFKFESGKNRLASIYKMYIYIYKKNNVQLNIVKEFDWFRVEVMASNIIQCRCCTTTSTWRLWLAFGFCYREFNYNRRKYSV